MTKDTRNAILAYAIILTFLAIVFVYAAFNGYI
jgi:hypothetical protein